MRRVDHSVIVIVGDKHLVTRIPCDFAEVLIDVVALELLLGIGPRHLIVATLDGHPDDALHGQLSPRIALEWHIGSRAALFDHLGFLANVQILTHQGGLFLGQAVKWIMEHWRRCWSLPALTDPVPIERFPAVVVAEEWLVKVL